MKKIHTFILTMMIFVITGLFPVAAWASPGPSDFQGADRQYNTSAGKGGGSSSDEGSSIYIPSDAHYVNGHYYKMYEMDYTWTEAKEYCSSQGGHLMTITTSEEQDILQNLGLKSGTNYWVGATDSKREGTWKWITGETWDYTHWAADQPDNFQQVSRIEEDYLQIVVNWGNGWNDSADQQDRTAKIGFICEWEPNRNAQEDNPSSGRGRFLEQLLSIFQL